MGKFIDELDAIQRKDKWAETILNLIEKEHYNHIRKYGEIPQMLFMHPRWVYDIMYSSQYRFRPQNTDNRFEIFGMRVCSSNDLYEGEIYVK